MPQERRTTLEGPHAGFFADEPERLALEVIWGFGYSSCSSSSRSSSRRFKTQRFEVPSPLAVSATE
jgi:hypothetical protein